MACYRSAVKHVPWPRWTRPQKRGIGGFPADGEEHGGRTLTVCPAGWRRGIVYRYCRDLERGKGERLADNGLVPRFLISWRRCVPLLLLFSPPAHRPTPGVDQMGWKRLCALLASRSARAKQGFFRRFPPGAECRLIDGRRIRDACLAGVGGDWWIRACSARGGTSLRLLGRIFDLERVFLGRILFLLLE